MHPHTPSLWPHPWPPCWRAFWRFWRLPWCPQTRTLQQQQQQLRDAGSRSRSHELPQGGGGQAHGQEGRKRPGLLRACRHWCCRCTRSHCTPRQQGGLQSLGACPCSTAPGHSPGTAGGARLAKKAAAALAGAPTALVGLAVGILPPCARTAPGGAKGLRRAFPPAPLCCCQPSLNPGAAPSCCDHEHRCFQASGAAPAGAPSQFWQ